ncbi:hypothetical protein SMC26_21815 [Actinomadura fulvescens]
MGAKDTWKQLRTNLAGFKPTVLDDRYKSAPQVARQVVEDSSGKAQRSKNGSHSCQPGSASFAKWFAERLGKQFGFTPGGSQADSVGRPASTQSWMPSRYLRTLV